MNKISIYILLVFMFLGLSRNFSTHQKASEFVQNETVFYNYFPEEILTVVLVDAFQAGFIMKTYYHRYEVIYAFKPSVIKTYRVSYKFWEKNKVNLGMSLYRRLNKEGSESYTPMPPGTLFIGNRAFGYWRKDNSGERFWRFHRAYRNFPKKFGWGKFKPSKSFYNELQTHLENEKSFYGLNNEFGSNGAVSKLKLVNKIKDSSELEINLKEHMKKFIEIPRSKFSSKRK